MRAVLVVVIIELAAALHLAIDPLALIHAMGEAKGAEPFEHPVLGHTRRHGTQSQQGQRREKMHGVHTAW